MVIVDAVNASHDRILVNLFNNPLSINGRFSLSSCHDTGRLLDTYQSQLTCLINSEESGADDGFRYPYLYLALYISDYSTERAVGVW